MNEKFVLIAPEEREIKEPFIFLAGPIQGAPDWQSKAIEIIHTINPLVLIANPRRPLFPIDNENAFDEQVDWETKYLNKAGENGLILFWLAKETEIIPGRAYAQTTRWELATWKERHVVHGVKLVIGIEEGFLGEKYIRKMLTKENPDIQVLNSLEEICKTALLFLDKSG